MGSLKAIFLTFLMTLVYYIPQGILALLVKFADWPINLFHPGFELVWAASSLLAYMLIFHWF